MIPSKTRPLIEDDGQLENVVSDGTWQLAHLLGFAGGLLITSITRVPLNKTPPNKAARLDHLFIRWRQAMNIARVLSVEELLLPYGLPKKGFPFSVAGFALSCLVGATMFSQSNQLFRIVFGGA